MSNMRTTKVCSKCGIEKTSDQFCARPERPIGIYSCCKLCKAQYRARRYRERRSSDPVALWAVNARNWAKDRSKRVAVPFSLEHQNILEALKLSKSRCTYCGNELNFRGTTRTRRTSPTLDRILPELGYIPKNVVVCCYRCNMIKNEASPEELQRLAEIVLMLVRNRKLRTTT